MEEAYKQLDDQEVYEEVPNEPNEEIRLRDDLSSDTLNYFIVKDSKFVRFYLLAKIYKRLHDVPGRLLISNCGFSSENISSFLDYRL